MNDRTNLEDVAPLIEQSPHSQPSKNGTGDSGGMKSVPLGTPISTRSGSSSGRNRRSGPNPSDLDVLGASPSKHKVRSLVRRRGLACCAAIAVAVVWIAVDYASTRRIEAEVGGSGSNDEVAHSSHLWGLRTEPGSVKSISILGERNSGTTWLYEHLGLCFNHTVPVRRRLTRYKHWFQHQTNRTDRQYEHSLVINEFRNVYDWTEAMHQVPHHAPNHIGLPWKQFVTSKWTMDRFGKDLEMADSDKIGRVCQEDFFYNDIITCNQRPYPDGYWNSSHKHRYSEHQPFYEMRNDGSGRPYDNILQLRAAKIYNFLSVVDFPWVEDMWVIRYESLLAEGTRSLLEAVEKATGVKAQCIAAEAQNRRKRTIDSKMMKWLTENVDWETERLIGYSKNQRSDN